ncbi:unnamed protein product [Phytophthora fragariaefolia]|uniref:Unnamed protein product n=1 Tax=Phytophthora fragariaefolia TaxID=1490495 RepID=A0A9W7D2E7_9STRA|nr:unnamed protein product [Phytophthora fragariaefolia]
MHALMMLCKTAGDSEYEPSEASGEADSEGIADESVGSEEVDKAEYAVKVKASSKSSGLSIKKKRRRLEAHDGMLAFLDVKLISTSNSKIDKRVPQRKRGMTETSPAYSTIALMVASMGEKEKVSEYKPHTALQDALCNVFNTTKSVVHNGANNVVINGADNGALLSSQVCKHNHFIDKGIYRALCRGEAVDAKQLGATVDILRSADVPMRNLAEFLCAETGALISKMLKFYPTHLFCLDQTVISQIKMSEIIVKHAMEDLTLNGSLLGLLTNTRKGIIPVSKGIMVDTICCSMWLISTIDTNIFIACFQVVLCQFHVITTVRRQMEDSKYCITSVDRDTVELAL